jgi:cell division protein FtsL
MGATEYALKKVVQNNAIVREIDEVRQREMWQWVCMGLLLVVVLVVSVWQHSAMVQHGYRVEALQRLRAEEEETSRQLRLQIETLRAPARIEALAIRLHMIAPGPDQAVVIERVVPAERPPASVVAAR